ncbi:hypothetical protein ACLBYD_23180 [Rhodococcus sp. C26F]
MELGLVLTLIGLAVTIGAALLGWLVGRRGRQRPDLRAATDFDIIIKSEDGILDRLHMDFDGNKIRSVSRTRIAIWNARGDTVRGSDILPTDKLRLQLDSNDLALHVRLISMSREQIDVKCKIDPDDPTAVVLSFDFLDASDGFVVELLHGSPTPAKLVGTIRGAAVPSGKSARLAPGDLDAVAARWFSRIVIAGSPITAMNFVMMGIGWFLVYELASDVFGKPEYVDASGYDLTTLEGQKSFSKAVREAGNTSIQGEIWMMPLMAFIIIGALAATYFTYAMHYKAAIPRSIVRIRPESSTGDVDEVTPS